MLGHELRNPLAPIRNAVAIIRASGHPGAGEERAAGVIERQVDHLARLVDDLLDVSRITSGKIALRQEPFDLATAVYSAIEGARPAIDRKRQVFRFDHDGRPLPVVGDHTRMTQVVLNLLNNASKYTPAGGHVSVTLERGDHDASVRVEDDGIGIPSDLRPRMFDLFVQGERGLDRAEGGLGIGLTLVRRLVDLHGGTVAVTSGGPGQGSRFEVRLPLRPDQGKPVPASSAAAAGGAKAASRRVLVVDDNEDSAETMASLVGLWGHAVWTASDAESALRAAAEHRPEVVLLDIGLPNVNGYDAAAQIRALPGLRDVVLIAMTGYGQEDDRRRTREAGFAHHLTKPVRPEELKEILSALP
jgi:CheY-like chemotaxis protein